LARFAVLLFIPFAWPSPGLGQTAPVPPSNVSQPPTIDPGSGGGQNVLRPGSGRIEGVFAPAPARNYLALFDWGRADLTDRAQDSIAEVANTARKVQTTRIEVAGHADRSGSAAYNQRLSQRRADAVAAELFRQGISHNEITVSAYGESRPLVPTADGVREPQNRRVEIVLR
jgi:outer membrane protein OmpA-like peptidoglycan-associated protein